MNHLSSFLPSRENLGPLLDLESTPHLEQLLGQVLMDPVDEFFKSPGKNLRPRLVELGYRLSLERDPEEISNAVKEKLALASSIVEMIHAGSLIVDDIQDGSVIRRNAPTLHLQFGMPLALNTGNWLYFWALSQVSRLELSADSHGYLLQDLLSLMGRAHLGQALDIGSKIDAIEKAQVRQTALASMELKTGTLMTLALRLGAAVAGAQKVDEKIQSLGRGLGLLLQMFDDVGNFSSSKTTQPSKRHEDLYNRRPGWVWAVASSFDEGIYAAFKSSVETLPDETELAHWMSTHNFERRLRSLTQDFSTTEKESWEKHFHHSHPDSCNQINDLLHILERAYVS